MASQDEHGTGDESRGDLADRIKLYGPVDAGYGDPWTPRSDSRDMQREESVTSIDYQHAERPPRNFSGNGGSWARPHTRLGKGIIPREISRERGIQTSSALSPSDAWVGENAGVSLLGDYCNINTLSGRSLRDHSVDSSDKPRNERPYRCTTGRGRGGRSRGPSERGGNRSGRGRFQRDSSYDGSRRLSVSSYSDSQDGRKPNRGQYSPAHIRDRDNYRPSLEARRGIGKDTHRQSNHNHNQLDTTTAPSEERGPSPIPMRRRPTLELFEPSRGTSTPHEDRGDTQQETSGIHPDRLKLLAQQEYVYDRSACPPPRQTRDRQPVNRDIVQPPVQRTSEPFSSNNTNTNDKAGRPRFQSNRGLSADDGHQWVRDMDSSGRGWGWGQGLRGRGRARGRSMGRGRGEGD
jgi:hypothetical protein